MKRLVASLLVLVMVLSVGVGFAGKTIEKPNGTWELVVSQDGSFDVFGMFTSKKGDIYIGTMLDEKYDGYGMTINKENDENMQMISFGTFKAGQRNGMNTTYYQDGSYIHAEYVDGLRQGYAAYVDNTGKCWHMVYEDGERVASTPTGEVKPLLFATINEADYTVTTRDAAGNLVAGHGLFMVSYQALYIGECNENLEPNGFGLYMQIKPQAWISNWTNGKIDGEGVNIKETGARVEAVWKDGLAVTE